MMTRMTMTTTTMTTMMMMMEIVRMTIIIVVIVTVNGDTRWRFIVTVPLLLVLLLTCHLQEVRWRQRGGVPGPQYSCGPCPNSWPPAWWRRYPDLSLATTSAPRGSPCPSTSPAALCLRDEPGMLPAPRTETDDRETNKQPDRDIQNKHSGTPPYGHPSITVSFPVASGQTPIRFLISKLSWCSHLINVDRCFCPDGRRSNGDPL